MSISAPFIRRPIATTLLSLGIALAGLVAYLALPVAPLPRIDLPTIVVSAQQPGADPAVMASSVAAPLERRLGAIAGVNELTSYSVFGQTTIVAQFALGRRIEDAAKDVMAAINAAANDLPAGLPLLPNFHKANPADAPVLMMALTSETMTAAEVYDAADTVILPRIAQLEGVSQVGLTGGEQPAVRVAVNPAAAAAAGIALEDIRTALARANVTQPVGLIDGTNQSAAIVVDDRLNTAADYAGIIIRARDGALVRLDAVAEVTPGARDRRQAATFNGRPATLIFVSKHPDANVIEVVDRVQRVLPELHRWIPPGLTMSVMRDSSRVIRASLHEVQRTLLLSVGLVVAVVALFLRRRAAVLAAAVAVPLSLLGTLAVMWLAGFSLNNLTLMALTVSVGFVVDDAIVMIENMVRLREAGMARMQAALEGARQIGFTVLSITASLVAVFIPLLFMPGVVGRMFHEFSATLAIAVALSGLISLTITPAVAAHLARSGPEPAPGRFGRGFEAGLEWLIRSYLRSLAVTLRWRRLMVGFTVALIGLTVWLYTIVPKDFFPAQDTGLMFGFIQAAPDTSFSRMVEQQERVVQVLRQDKAIASIGALVGGNGATTNGRIFISLTPVGERPGVTPEDVVTRLRPQLSRIPGVQVFIRPVSDVTLGGRISNAGNQYVLLSPDLEELQTWSEALLRKLRTLPELTDVNSDQQRSGLVTRLVLDRDQASRLGVRFADVNNALNDAFAQRQVSIMYRNRNQYRVVLEIDPALTRDPTQLDGIHVPGAGGVLVPLAALVTVERSAAPLTVTHQGQFPAATISFNLPEGVTLGQASAAVEQAQRELGMPASLRGEWAGNARAFQNQQRGEGLLMLAAVVSIYIVLGMLYESLIHPITIISTLPSAGIGALLALLATGTSFSLIAFIAVILLMGIVKKNAIMLVDFALEHEREHGWTAERAIVAACRERFRPILMTTLAALFGAVPLALAAGPGSELRQPLGIAIIGGLALSQLLTLYTTPAVYLALESLAGGRRQRTGAGAPMAAPGPALGE